jgi:hypothetical protein
LLVLNNTDVSMWISASSFVCVSTYVIVCLCFTYVVLPMLCIVNMCLCLPMCVSVYVSCVYTHWVYVVIVAWTPVRYTTHHPTCMWYSIKLVGASSANKFMVRLNHCFFLYLIFLLDNGSLLNDNPMYWLIQH